MSGIKIEALKKEVIESVKSIYPDFNYYYSIGWPNDHPGVKRDEIESILNEIRSKMYVNAYFKGEPIDFHWNWEIEITFDENIPTYHQVVTDYARWNELVEEHGNIIQMTISLSFLRRYGYFFWNGWYPDYKRNFATFQTPDVKRCIELEQVVKDVLENHQIQFLPEEIVKMQFPEFGEIGYHTIPTVVHCLFKEM
jgi:hypothetical protein